MDLLTGKGLKQIKLPGVIKHEHIYNDYHVPKTNPGYSSNYAGRHFTKWSYIWFDKLFLLTKNTHLYYISSNEVKQRKFWKKF